MTALAGEWISARDALAAIDKVLPGEHAGKELANAAMKAAFNARARLGIFTATDGTGALVRRETNLIIPSDWWWPSIDGPPRGMQVLNLSKAEGWAIIEQGLGIQRVDLIGIQFLRADLEAHFGLASSASLGGGKRGPKAKYDADAFVAAASGALERQGGYVVGEFDRGALKREMQQWCADNWEVEPGETWINEQLAKAEDCYRLLQ